MTEMEMVVETLVCWSFNYFARLIAQRILILYDMQDPKSMNDGITILVPLRILYRLFQRPLAF